MKLPTAAICLMLMAFGASVAFAQDKDQPPPRGPGEGMHRPPPPIIAALDLNHDGVIDKDEIAKASESLKTLDKNGDGQLTLDEIRPPRRPEGEQPSPQPQQSSGAKQGAPPQHPGKP
jgi:hypothetical protein